MRRIVLFIFTLCASLTLSAQGGMVFETGTLDKALAKAKKLGKLVFVDCYTTSCGPCKYMANNVFTTKEAGDYFNKSFVNIKIEMTTAEGDALAKKYVVTGYPTFLLLDFDGKEVGRSLGSTSTAKDFIEVIERAQDKRNTLEYISEAYVKNKNTENAYNYLTYLYNNSMYDKMVEITIDSFPLFDEFELFTDRMWKFVKYAMFFSDDLFDYVIDHRFEACTYAGDTRVNNELKSYYSAKLVGFLVGNISLSKEKSLEYAKSLNLLITSNDYAKGLVAKLAKWYLTGNTEAIIESFTFGNLRDLRGDELAELEKIYSGFDCISKEKFANYQASKEQFARGDIDYSIQFSKQLLEKK